ncbi:MAG: elongation factor P [Bacteroidota bacterium]|nr:elongation factor P [Bacteroidota bacterium]MDP4231313.1 elongation factor P [Bacteroidota bacterium]MDP4236693.1 elongation factor P [Bacteroidota bacterium]
MASTNDFRNGAVLKMDGELYRIEEYEHRTPGNLRAFVQAKLRSLRTGNLKEMRYRSGEEVEMIRMEKKTFQYLYKDGDDFVFMNTETYEQINVPSLVVGDVAKYIRESDNADIVFAEDGTIVSVEVPASVILTITETDPGMRGDTATGGTKPAKLETGAMVNVPLFLNEGDMVKVDTRTGQYLERVKK